MFKNVVNCLAQGGQCFRPGPQYKSSSASSTSKRVGATLWVASFLRKHLTNDRAIELSSSCPAQKQLQLRLKLFTVKKIEQVYSIFHFKTLFTRRVRFDVAHSVIPSWSPSLKNRFTSIYIYIYIYRIAQVPCLVALHWYCVSQKLRIWSSSQKRPQKQFVVSTHLLLCQCFRSMGWEWQGKGYGYTGPQAWWF